MESTTRREYVSAKDTAKLVRKALKRDFPGVKFSVRTEDGTAINIRWTDGPLQRHVDSTVAPYKGGGFDGMIDLEYYQTAWLMPDGSVSFAETQGTEGSRGYVAADMAAPPHKDAQLVQFGATYIFTERRHSKPFIEEVIRRVVDRWVDDGQGGPEVKISEFDGTAYMDGDRVTHRPPRAGGYHDLRDLVHQALQFTPARVDGMPGEEIDRRDL